MTEANPSRTDLQCALSSAQNKPISARRPSVNQRCWITKRHLDSKRACCHDAAMRTTVTLDPDVEQLLRDAMQQRRQSFKEALNQAIRAGLSGSGGLGVADRPFTLHPQPMGLRAGIDSGRLNQLADELESDAFADLSRRLLHGEKPRPRRPK